MAVFIKKVNIPQKSDLINIDMTGSGTAQTYRVLKNVSGTIYEVMAMENASTGQQFASSGQMYENSLLDTFLNSTWYNTLSNTAKSAIVDKTFRQDSWYDSTQGNPDYQGKYRGSVVYQISLGNASFGNEITRHAYVISVQDVIDYLEVTPEMTQADTTLTNDDVWQMFWNSTTSQSDYLWLRSADASDASHAFRVAGGNGNVSDYTASKSIAVRPAFQIDLSKIDYTFTDGRQPVELKPVSILQKSNNALSRVGMSWKQIVYPSKGDIVDIDMTGSGTPQRFRVIKANNNIVEVVALANASDSQQFASSGRIYENSALDTYLNLTWYNTLSNIAQLAIVDKTFRQDSWYDTNNGSPIYSGYSGQTKPGTNAYVVSLGNASFGNEITRHCYALGIQDVLDYVLDTNITDGELQNYNIWKMFWDDEVQHTGNNNFIWLHSANGLNSETAFRVIGINGGINFNYTSSSSAVRPAFQIDLSKIDFTIE